MTSSQPFLVTLLSVIAALLSVIAAGDDSKNRALNTLPMIMAHDAGSGYLNADAAHQPARDLLYGWTKTQSGGLAEQLQCGARALDSRPFLLSTGRLIWHHGGVPVNHSFAESLQEVLGFCHSNPSELVLMLIWDCTAEDGGNGGKGSSGGGGGGGDGGGSGAGSSSCDEAVASALEAAMVPTLTDCNDFANLTVASAMARSALAPGNNGHLLAIPAPALAAGGEAACSYSNYPPSNGCSGVGTREEVVKALARNAERDESAAAATAGSDDDDVARVRAALECSSAQPSSSAVERRSALAACATAAASADTAAAAPSATDAVYRCYDGDERQQFPLDRMFAYLDATSAAGPPADDPTAGPDGTGRQLYQMQALWQVRACLL